ncbi:hypothetical protein BGZ83_001520 [Gryganskiella cystojenkinii]|nr:hypothetical protein BGZ83_001520 [Gryganskiella cystojenkinii]
MLTRSLRPPKSTFASNFGRRCRPKQTQAYNDDFTGPDSFHDVIDEPEYYVANQQINLGNCTYAIPYVLSRPGKFWLTEIEHI